VHSTTIDFKSNNGNLPRFFLLLVPQLSKPSPASIRQQAALTHAGSVKVGTAKQLSDEEVERFAAMLGRLDRLAQAAKDGTRVCSTLFCVTDSS
jgi:hypothetical protein